MDNIIFERYKLKISSEKIQKWEFITHKKYKIIRI